MKTCSRCYASILDVDDVTRKTSKSGSVLLTHTELAICELLSGDRRNDIPTGDWGPRLPPPRY